MPRATPSKWASTSLRTWSQRSLLPVTLACPPRAGRGLAFLTWAGTRNVAAMLVHVCLWNRARACRFCHDLRYSGSALPTSVDWVGKGAVTDPKNQGKCGSCWSFSTTGALEGAWQIATGKLVSLSEQQLVDCAKNGNMGCNGGSMDLAFEYLEKFDVCTEDSYPYKAKQGTCLEKNCTVAVPKGSIVGFKDVTPQDTNALMEAVSQQPVSVAIEADQMAFQLYTGGILTKKCGKKLDHGVLAVGYGTENGVDYWKARAGCGHATGQQN